MCGIVGVVSTQAPVAQAIYDGLGILQHRGQDAAGVMTCDDMGRTHHRRANGLVRDVFREKHMRRLQGHYGIGHVRYPTAGSSSSAEAQPFFVNSPYGIAIAHNGNLTNVEELQAELFAADLRHINTNSDSEILLNVFAHELQKQNHKQDVQPLTPEVIFKAVERVHQRVRGAYAVVIMIVGFGLVAFRDPHGIRPLVFGASQVDGTPQEFMVASESVAFDVQGLQRERDVAAGEAICIEMDGTVSAKQCATAPQMSPCIFEYVYFARPDSMIDDVSVYKARLRMGDELAHKILRDTPDHDIDVVIPIPDTSRVSAVQVAHHLGVKYREGFIKNRYVGRTFIMAEQSQRRKSVRQKLNAIDLEFKDKNVLLVDDSIVRGTTAKEIIQMSRESGARRVYLASAAPAVRYPNVYGIDMPKAAELVAHGRSDADVAAVLGADHVYYQELPDLIAAVQAGNSALTAFDTSCFDGRYVTGDVSEDYLRRLEMERADGQKQAEQQRERDHQVEARAEVRAEARIEEPLVENK